MTDPTDELNPQSLFWKPPLIRVGDQVTLVVKGMEERGSIPFVVHRINRGSIRLDPLPTDDVTTKPSQIMNRYRG